MMIAITLETFIYSDYDYQELNDYISAIKRSMREQEKKQGYVSHALHVKYVYAMQEHDRRVMEILATQESIFLHVDD